MNSVIKSEKTDSPKTPGGISRSLLTPCRRIGLSRNWRKSGISPFQSPLPSSNEVQREDVVRKRKVFSSDIVATPEHSNDSETSTEVDQTPTRSRELPQRKKSKTLLSTINKRLENNEPKQPAGDISKSSENNINEIPCIDISTHKIVEVNTENVQPLVQLKSKSKSKTKISPMNLISKITISPKEKNGDINMNVKHNDNSIKSKETEKKSPKDLTKECIVVLQKKMFKHEFKNKENQICHNEIVKEKECTSQILFDSDSDDVPLVNFNNNENVPNIITLSNEGDEFTRKSKIKTLDNISKTKLKPPKLAKNNPNSKEVSGEILSISQNSEDDDFVEKKKTILVRKSYTKVTNPQKAKSTGSITQRDIDELKARIETKKKKLLARAMTDDTKELKDLIKKWQKGCQEALIELMDLMRNKIPDKQNMDYSEMLQALKIPASLVGYDSDNDCFLTPTDEDVVLAKFKN